MYRVALPLAHSACLCIRFQNNKALQLTVSEQCHVTPCPVTLKTVFSFSSLPARYELKLMPLNRLRFFFPFWQFQNLKNRLTSLKSSYICHVCICAVNSSVKSHFSCQKPDGNHSILYAFPVTLTLMRARSS